MDLLVVVIILAMVATVVTTVLGLISMSGGGATDRDFSTPLMWTRIAFQALTLLLLGIAILVR
jgi:Hypoxia induced protein conserved region